MFPMQIYPEAEGNYSFSQAIPFSKIYPPAERRGKKGGEKRGNETILQNSQENNIVSVQGHSQRKSTIK